MKQDVKQIAIFVTIGGTAAFITAILTWLGLNTFRSISKPIVTVCVYAIMIMPVYFLQHRFSFGGKAEHKSALPKYISVQMVSVAMSFVLSWLFLVVLRLPNSIGSFIVVATTSIGSFIALKLWAFASHAKP